MKWTSRITKLAFKLHGWVGLTAGLLFLLFGITGAALMFRGSLDRHFNPELHRLQPRNKMVSVSSICRMIIQTHPNLKKVVLHDFPRDKYDSYEFMVYRNQQAVGENYLYFVFVNPYTGSILKEGSYRNITPSFFRWLYSFHYSLQLGMPGKLFTAVTGLLMLLSLLTGTVIYRKHFWKALRFKAGLNFKNRRTAVSGLHRIVGVWALICNAVLFFTGFWMNKEQFQPTEWKISEPVTNHVFHADIDSIIDWSKHAVKGFEPIAVNIPTVAGQDIIVRGHMPSTSFFLLQGKASNIAYDMETGTLKHISNVDHKPFSERFEWEVYQLHTGLYAGTGIRWLYVLMGLAPGVLCITGAMLWMKRK